MKMLFSCAFVLKVDGLNMQKNINKDSIER